MARGRWRGLGVGPDPLTVATPDLLFGIRFIVGHLAGTVGNGDNPVPCETCAWLLASSFSLAAPLRDIR
jgi:hypothetical protein